MGWPEFLQQEQAGHIAIAYRQAGHAGVSGCRVSVLSF
jgi:hypothetical protein